MQLALARTLINNKYMGVEVGPWERVDGESNERQNKPHAHVGRTWVT